MKEKPICYYRGYSIKVLLHLNKITYHRGHGFDSLPANSRILLSLVSRTSSSTKVVSTYNIRAYLAQRGELPKVSMSKQLGRKLLRTSLSITCYKVFRTFFNMKGKLLWYYHSHSIKVFLHLNSYAYFKWAPWKTYIVVFFSLIIDQIKVNFLCYRDGIFGYIWNWGTPSSNMMNQVPWFWYILLF